MRALPISFLFVSIVSCCVSACSPPPSDENVTDPGTESAASTAPSEGPVPQADSDAAIASGASPISFNAGQAAESEVWFTQVEGANACAANSSPAEAIARLQALGATPDSMDTQAGDDSRLEVVVSGSDGHVPKSTTYYRTLSECEGSLATEQTVPDQYK